jgi:hypothetical protein
LLEAAAPRALRAGERAALVAEQFALEQVLRDRRGVDRDERPAARGLCGAARARRAPCRCPDSPVISTGRVRLRQPPDRAEDLLHRRRLAEDFRRLRARRRDRRRDRASRSVARRISAIAWSTSNGFGRYSNAPPWNACTALSRSEYAVITMTGMCG